MSQFLASAIWQSCVVRVNGISWYPEITFDDISCYIKLMCTVPLRTRKVKYHSMVRIICAFLTMYELLTHYLAVLYWAIFGAVGGGGGGIF